MPVRFRQWLEQAVGENFEWPNSNRMGNILNYLREQYIDNVQINLRTHCKNRLKMFFKFRAYTMNVIQLQNQRPILFDNDDIKIAVNWTYNFLDSTGGDAERIARLEIFLDELRLFGAPDDCHIRRFVENNWFQSLRMWLNIQRDIEHFNKVYANLRNDWNLFRKYPQFVTRPLLPAPPEIHNFSAIPICSSQRRHIKIDTASLRSLLCEIDLVPKKPGQRKNTFINVTQNEFLSDKPGNWFLFFDRDKITRMVNGKKVFGNSIITDGVAATVLYDRPANPEPPISKAEVLRQLMADSFHYIIGIDPGMRTFNATVRMDLRTGEEVSEFN